MMNLFVREIRENVIIEKSGSTLWCRLVIPATGKAEAGEQVQDQPGLQIKFEASLGNSTGHV